MRLLLLSVVLRRAQVCVSLWTERIKPLPCRIHCQTDMNSNIFRRNIVRFLNWFAEITSKIDFKFSTPFQFLTSFSVLTNYSIGVFPGIIYTCSWCIPDGDKMCIICQHHATYQSTKNLDICYFSSYNIQKRIDGIRWQALGCRVIFSRNSVKVENTY